MFTYHPFRQDLFYRLNTLQLHLPPLRERSGDIEELARHFLTWFCSRYRKKAMALDGRALNPMREYDRPGNIRELSNILERGCLQCRGRFFTADLLSQVMGKVKTVAEDRLSPANGFDLAASERDLIAQVLEQYHGNQSRAGLQPGITRNPLRYRIKKYGIRKDEN